MDIKETNLLLTDQPSRPVQILLVLWGIALSGSRVFFGLNLSWTTILLPILLLVIFLSYGYDLKFAAIDLFLCFTGIYALLISATIMPYLVPGSPIDKSAIIKYLIIIIYFFIAQQLPFSAIKTIFRAFVNFNVLIAVIGIISTLAGLQGTLPFMYYSAERFFGFMNDPNYFSLVQAMSVCILIASDIKFKHSNILSILLISSMLLSGSKTSVVVVIVLTTIILIKYFINNLNTLYRVFLGLIPIICLIIVIYFTKQFWIPYAQNLGEILGQSPLVQRLMSLFDPNALDSGGSGRTILWEIGLKIIDAVHGIGVGMTSYLSVSQILFNVSVLSHNTFLQLMAQWGVPLASIFLIWLILRVIYNLHVSVKFSKTLALMVATIFIYFIALSLNNSPLVWFVFGIVFSERNNHHLIESSD
ncbi:hypothetical protein FC84_GL000760 [Lapidilactobacillus dextrinicus DSM 20335]|uniref:O-antigen ligase-related domain-containing protein n=1 Tax=Lapidilactobacillus dextrinicus DSM 20335 TaxID=1423738 RepID=A0A0R2BGY2_9LACO|nr:O-antigen ligase family protein [Lapidilactobacillus dextrinicus]KRM78503.1 hypothetical protein FC84_GL000760 [Lapidilactobacillus dextrinicus DSM 20335]QFG46169.1 hypothetical protein LH506_01280 [Lapidilactobacillus dextrinicus]